MLPPIIILISLAGAASPYPPCALSFQCIPAYLSRGEAFSGSWSPHWQSPTWQARRTEGSTPSGAALNQALMRTDRY